ncbi:MAG: hypothetical protein WAU36_01685 [Cyclobacteriaceae bacterium]
MAAKEEKACLECGEKIVGRADKKFCSDQCRVSYNNRINGERTNYVRNVNNILGKNRRIMEELNPSGKTKVNRNKLSVKGFDFAYHTDTYRTKEGAYYRYCYEQGYLEIDPKTVLIVKKEIK